MEILLLAFILILPGLLSIAYDVVKLLIEFSIRKIKASLQSNYRSEPEAPSVLTPNFN